MSLFRVSVENKENLVPSGLLDSLWVPIAAWLMANAQAGCLSLRYILQIMRVYLCLGRQRRAGATWTNGKTRSQSKCIICIMTWLWYQSKHLPYFTFIKLLSKNLQVERRLSWGRLCCSDFVLSWHSKHVQVWTLSQVFLLKKEIRKRHKLK